MNKKISNLFNNKSILITGGTGSFGKTFLSKIVKFNFKEVLIFSRDEKNKRNDNLLIQIHL